MHRHRFPHVCLACRKSFKLNRRADKTACPDCAGELHPPEPSAD